MAIYGLLAIIFVWLLIVSVLIWQTSIYIKKNRVFGHEDLKLQHEVGEIKKVLKQEIDKSKLHLQKIGLVRLKDQSFVIALTDQMNNGVTANFIYTRDGLRVYVKRVKAGRGEEYDLSEEEKKAIEKC